MTHWLESSTQQCTAYRNIEFCPFLFHSKVPKDKNCNTMNVDTSVNNGSVNKVQASFWGCPGEENNVHSSNRAVQSDAVLAKVSNIKKPDPDSKVILWHNIRT